MNFPNEILLIIYKFGCVENIAFTEKELYSSYLREKESSTKIQKWIRPLLKIDVDDMSKSRLINLFCSTYDLNYLLVFPTFLVKKCKMFQLMDEAKIAEQTGSKKSIKRFLNRPEISKDDILYAGW